VEPRDAAASPDTLRLTVDGDVFDVVYDPAQPGAYHYTRLTGPAPGYGSTSRCSDHARCTTAEHVEAIRSFLAMVDPVTGYIEDDPDDEGEDVTLDD
jgi:hypothetical protein